MSLVDSHCHLDLLDGSISDYITRAQERGVHYILNVCITLADFPRVLKTAMAYPNVGASVGMHPNEQSEKVELQTLLTLGQHEKVIAIGETGLDYYRSTGEVEWQRERFRTHIQAAKQLQKPLIVHTRAAIDDTIRIMQEENAEQARGVMHCFSEDWNAAKKALDMNFYISFSGTVTFKNATIIQEVAKQVPLDRILIETDAPYLAPIPHRGKPNEPSYVCYTAQAIARLRNITDQAFAEQTTDNFFRLFKGAVRPHV